MADWKLLKQGVYKRVGSKKTSYRVQPMVDGKRHTKVFQAKTDAEAVRKSKRIIADLLEPTKKTEAPQAMWTWDMVAQENLKVLMSKRAKTYISFEGTTRVHLLPFLREHAPYVVDENPELLWLKYKIEKSHLKLFNHHKAFNRMCRFAFKKGILQELPELEWDRRVEDKREEGQVLSEAEFEALVDAANPDWKDRMIIGWHTGMRPGEIRCLQKSRVDFDKGIIRLTEDDTKTKTAREFAVPPVVMAILARRRLATDSVYFFPNTKDPGRPINPNAKSWRSAVTRAGIERNITPHDLRHTYVTRSLQDSSIPPLVLCFAIGMSLQEMQKTYMHMTAEDTRVLFKKSAP